MNLTTPTPKRRPQYGTVCACRQCMPIYDQGMTGAAFGFSTMSASGVLSLKKSTKQTNALREVLKRRGVFFRAVQWTPK